MSYGRYGTAPTPAPRDCGANRQRLPLGAAVSMLLLGALAVVFNEQVSAQAGRPGRAGAAGPSAREDVPSLRPTPVSRPDWRWPASKVGVGASAGKDAARERSGGTGAHPTGPESSVSVSGRRMPVRRRVQAGALRPEDDAAIGRQLRWSSAAAPEPSPEAAVRAAAARPADDAAISRQLERGRPSGPAAAFAADTPSLTVRPAVQDPVTLPFRYAAARAAVPVYAAPGGARPLRWLDPAGRWVAIAKSVQRSDGLWHELAIGGWVPQGPLTMGTPSRLRGIVIDTSTPRTIGLVATDILNVRAHAGIADTNPPVAQLARYDVVEIRQEMVVDGAEWYRIGQSLWVYGGYVRRVPWAERPARVGADEQWIDVNLSRQTLVAHQGDTPVFATLVSAGLPRTPTWEGLSRIWIELVWTKMSGGDRAIPGDYYWLDHVPFTMFFHADYGLHAAYWHDDFGRPKSHGCVNLSPSDAEWLFNWTTLAVDADDRVARASEDQPGTWVWTHR